MTHRDGLSALSVRSQYRRDALDHKMPAPPFSTGLGPKALKGRRFGRFWELSEGVSKP